jgi:hypothetical protein
MPDDTRILVLSDRRASPDGGEHFHNYVAGQVYARGTVPPMSVDLAAEALREGWGEPGPECLWCGGPYARRATGGQPQKFCSSACRRACHTAARRWAVREIEAGRLSVANVLGRG